MPIALAGSVATGSGGNTNSASISHTLNTASGSDRLMIVIVHARGNEASDSLPSSVTYNGVAMTQSHTVFPSGFQTRATIYHMLNASLPASTGTYTVQADWSSNTQNWAIGAYLLTGASQSGPEATGGQAGSGGGSSFSYSINTVSANAWIVEGLTGDGSVTTWTPSPQVARYNVSIGAGSTRATTSAGSYTNTATFNFQNRFGVAAAAFAEAAGVVIVPNAPFFGANW